MWRNYGKFWKMYGKLRKMYGNYEKCMENVEKLPEIMENYGKCMENYFLGILYKNLHVFTSDVYDVNFRNFDLVCVVRLY